MEHAKLRINLLDGSRPAEKVLALEGVLNSDTAFQLNDFVREQRPQTLVVDMTRVRSLDSSGLGVLIGLYASFERANRYFLLAGLNDRIWDLFRMCKIADVFTRYPTVAEAEQVLPVPAANVAPN